MSLYLATALLALAAAIVTIYSLAAENGLPAGALDLVVLRP